MSELAVDVKVIRSFKIFVEDDWKGNFVDLRLFGVQRSIDKFFEVVSCTRVDHDHFTVAFLKTLCSSTPIAMSVFDKMGTTFR